MCRSVASCGRPGSSVCCDGVPASCPERAVGQRQEYAGEETDGGIQGLLRLQCLS